MNGTIHIAQISDCHLPAIQEMGYRGIDAWTNLARLLDHLRNLNPDMILATGDLSEDATIASYRVLRDMFRKLGKPVLALPGNHDDAHLLEQFFPSSPVDTLQHTNHGDWQIIRLNSCVPKKPYGQLGEKTLLELEDVLTRSEGRPSLIALHHQPLIANSPWIDKYRLVEPEPFLRLVDQYTDVKAVVWGHIHREFEEHRNGILMLGSPSTAINGLSGTEKFTASDCGPACRWLELGSDGSLHSSVVTIHSAKP